MEEKCNYNLTKHIQNPFSVALIIIKDVSWVLDTSSVLFEHMHHMNTFPIKSTCDNQTPSERVCLH